MEVAPFFVDFHHFLSIFTIFYWFSRFTHFCRDLHFVAIYALFPQFFLPKIAFSATSHVFCMYEIEKSTWTQTMSSSSSSGKMTFSYRWLDWLVSFPQVYSDGVWPLGMVFGKALLVVKICKTLKCCHDQIPHKGIKLQSFQPVAWRWYTARLKSEAGKAWASDVHRWRC